MTSVIFQRWLKSWNSKLKEESRNVLLLLDNFKGHSLPKGGVSNIQVELFAPNLTSHAQPLDAGIIKCFKSYYQKKTILRLINLFTEELEKKERTPMKDMFKVNQLVAMRISKKAWDSLSTSTIANCWGATKIIKSPSKNCEEVVWVVLLICFLIPLGSFLLCRRSDWPHSNFYMHYIIRNKTIINSEAALEAQLNTLEKIGAVLPCNRMSIHYLLNPDGENNLAIQMRSNEEIFASV